MHTWLTALVVLAGCGGTPATPDAPVRSTWPPPSAGHELVYVDSLNAVVLVNAGLGGHTQPASNSPTELWSWDGTRWTVLDRSGPPVRNLAGVAYDSAHDELVMHGGSYSLDLMYGDTWTWKPQRGWLKFAGAGPGVRDHLRMTYDVARGQVVLFGGEASLTDFPATTWTWNGTAWTEMGAGPQPRVHHAMTYDAARSEVVVFGGFAPGVGDRGDTWSWNGSAWTQAAESVAARTHSRMAFDGNRSAPIIVGSGGPASDPVLVRDDASWRDLGVSGLPGRYLTGVAYDKHRNVLVVFGGGKPDTDRLLDDLWELDASAWHQVH